MSFVLKTKTSLRATNATDFTSDQKAAEVESWRLSSSFEIDVDDITGGDVDVVEYSFTASIGDQFLGTSHDNVYLLALKIVNDPAAGSDPLDISIDGGSNYPMRMSEKGDTVIIRSDSLEKADFYLNSSTAYTLSYLIVTGT